MIFFVILVSVVNLVIPIKLVILVILMNLVIQVSVISFQKIFGLCGLKRSYSGEKVGCHAV